MGQNKYPMKIAMVSVFVEDPVKTDWGYEAIFEDANGNYIQLILMN
jgi:hypothetical protein